MKLCVKWENYNVVSSGLKVLRSGIAWHREFKKVPFAVPIAMDSDASIVYEPNLQYNIELVKPLKISGKNWTYCKGWARCDFAEKILLQCTLPEELFLTKQYYRKDIVEFLGLKEETHNGFEALLPIAIRDLRKVSILVGNEKKWNHCECSQFFI